MKRLWLVGWIVCFVGVVALAYSVAVIPLLGERRYQAGVRRLGSIWRAAEADSVARCRR